MTTHARPILRFQRHVAASVLGRAYVVHQSMSDEAARFPAPNPPLDVLHGQITKVEDANKQAKLHVRGAVQVRDLELTRLVGMLQSECTYVRTLCDASPEEADIIIKASGFAASAARVYDKPLLQVSLGPTSGSVVLTAAVGAMTGGRFKTRVFHWQWTTDGLTFHDARSTAGGKTVITGLTPLTTVGFRVSASIGDVPGEWTPVVNAVVH